MESISETLLKLGLLHEVTLEEKTSLTGRMKWLMFPQKLVQEYWAGYYSSKRLHLVSTKVNFGIVEINITHKNLVIYVSCV